MTQPLNANFLQQNKAPKQVQQLRFNAKLSS
jgi:hypothetical protein